MKLSCTFVLSFVLLHVQATVDQETLRKHLVEMRKEIKTYMTSESIEFFADVLDDKVHNVNEFRIIIPPKKMQCYYQDADKSSTLIFHFESLTSPTFGSSGRITVTASRLGDESNSGKPIEIVSNKRYGEIEVEVEKAGTYGFCLDNTASRDVINAQVALEIWNKMEATKFHMKNQLGNDSVYHIFDELFRVTQQVSTMRSAVTHSRSSMIYDYRTRSANLKMVDNFSVISMVLIVAVSFLQLHFLKRMFGNNSRVGV